MKIPKWPPTLFRSEITSFPIMQMCFTTSEQRLPKFCSYFWLRNFLDVHRKPSHILPHPSCSSAFLGNPPHHWGIINGTGNSLAKKTLPSVWPDMLSKTHSASSPPGPCDLGDSRVCRLVVAPGRTLVIHFCSGYGISFCLTVGLTKALKWAFRAGMGYDFTSTVSATAPKVYRTYNKYLLNEWVNN